jgi:aldehyde dehydrogenase (NAD+)
MSNPDPAALRALFDRQAERLPAIRRTGAAERIERLRRLRRAVAGHLDDLRAALRADFGKPEVETDLTEYLAAMGEIDHAIRHVRRWMRPKRVPTPLMLFGTRSRVHREPKGQVLIIGPWNYPFNLTLSPLVAAVAAGNCVILKPSEMTPRTSELIARVVAEAFLPEEVAVVQGDKDLATALLELPFHHIFFTGSTRVGRIVMTAAARNLTPVTLELGGKCPVILDASADLAQAASRLAWGKFLNGGQTCIAPDYLLAPEPLVEPFVREFEAAVKRFFGPDPDAHLASEDLAQVINPAAFRRLRGLVEDTVKAGARLEMGGRYDEARRRIAPTLLSGVSFDMPVMGEEIFGPILPVIAYRDRSEVYARLRTLPKPLALYVFARDGAVIDEVLRETSAGGTSVNNTILHVANPSLPFGGDGPSGIGKYHGEAGFLAFGNERAVLRQSWPDISPLLHPPYSAAVRDRLGWIRRFLG